MSQTLDTGLRFGRRPSLASYRWITGSLEHCVLPFLFIGAVLTNLSMAVCDSPADEKTGDGQT